MSNFENKPLNTTDGWEEIVNANAAQRSVARERVAARKRARRIRKMGLTASVMAVASIVSVILGVTGAVVGWLAMIAAVALLAASSVLTGRYLEAKKK